MTETQRKIIAELESATCQDGLEHHLEAARALARDGIDAETMAGMMRFMFSNAQIAALLAEAATKREIALPVIA